jgi:transcriptional regulator with XRE-family HTH domain
MNMPGTNIEVGERVLALMKQRGLTAKELAPELGIRASNLHHIIHGRSALKPAVALSLVEYFGITLAELYAKDPLPNPVIVYLRFRPGEDREKAIREVQEAVRKLRERKNR